MTNSRERLILVALALVWVALRIPHFGTRYAFNWDSINYARGIAEFDVQKLQPHPPGFPLWVFSARGLTPLAGGAMQGQIWLAFFVALFAFGMFYALARQIFPEGNTAAMCTLLLAYAPGVALNSSISSSSIVDLASSAVAGYLAFLDPRRKAWRIILCLIALGVLAGFRPSGFGLLVPFIALALLLHLRHAWRPIITGVLLGTLSFLAWFIPLAKSVGGVGNLSKLTNDHFLNMSHLTSIFLGGPAQRYFGMLGEGLIGHAMNIAPWLAAFGIAFLWRKKPVERWWLYAVWAAPNLIMVLAIHSGRVGQSLLDFPPLLLLCAILGKPRLRTTIVGVLVALTISYFPYGALQFSPVWKLNYLFYRATPRMALDLEASQRNLDRVLDELRRSGAPQPFVCARHLTEAPNINSVRYDFGDFAWVSDNHPPDQRAMWVFDQNGPDAKLRERFSGWRRLTGDPLISVWEAIP